MLMAACLASTLVCHRLGSMAQVMEAILLAAWAASLAASFPHTTTWLGTQIRVMQHPCEARLCMRARMVVVSLMLSVGENGCWRTCTVEQEGSHCG